MTSSKKSPTFGLNDLLNTPQVLQMVLDTLNELKVGKKQNEIR